MVEQTRGHGGMRAARRATTESPSHDRRPPCNQPGIRGRHLVPHESCVPRTKVSHRPACEHPRENDTWSSMKAPSGRRSPDHSLPITCPNLPPGGYFVKPTFDRISWTTVVDVYGTTVEQADTKCVLYTPEGLTAYKGYMAPTFTRLQFFSSDSTVRK